MSNTKKYYNLICHVEQRYPKHFKVIRSEHNQAAAHLLRCGFLGG